MITTKKNRWFAFIPNLLTLLNLSCGTVALYFAFHNYIDVAIVLMLAGAFFDFTDGLVARILKVTGELGKQLDSLADLVTFGILPGVMIFSTQKNILFEWVGNYEQFTVLHWIILFSALLIPVLSALRLAKFNIDTRQTDSFIGLPTPANALFFASVVWTIANSQSSFALLIGNPFVLGVITLIFSLLLISEIPLFALKFKTLKAKENLFRYLFLLISLVVLISLKIPGVALIVLLYMVLSLIENAFRIRKTLK